MELVEAKLLQSAIDANPPLDFAEKRTITRHRRAPMSEQSLHSVLQPVPQAMCG